MAKAPVFRIVVDLLDNESHVNKKLYNILTWQHVVRSLSLKLIPTCCISWGGFVARQVA